MKLNPAVCSDTLQSCVSATVNLNYHENGYRPLFRQEISEGLTHLSLGSHSCENLRYFDNRTLRFT